MRGLVEGLRNKSIARHLGVAEGTRRALCVLGPAHPPSFYLPWSDVRATCCEWKWPARCWSLLDGARRLPSVA